MLSATKNRALRWKSQQYGGEIHMRTLAPIAAVLAVLACITWVVLICQKQRKNLVSIFPETKTKTHI